MTAPARQPEGGFGIYVHWPFCAAKCPYCDFNSHVRKGIDHAAWADALCTDLAWQASRLDGRPRVDAVFFGGGTPSLMDPRVTARVLETIARLFPIAPDVEITLEANPTSADAARFEAYARAGVNRASLGVQALNDEDLKALGRWHSAAEALAAYDLACRYFPRTSFDLIYARPHQTLAAWEQELRRALSRAHGHLSLYQLTIEPGTPFAAAHARGALVTPAEDLAARMYELTQALCEDAGRPAYEISNHASPGDESRHNLIYWRYGEYLGVGPGAHGRVAIQGCKRATIGLRQPEAWLRAVEAYGTGLETQEEVAPADQAHEYLLMGLRLKEGIDLVRYERLGGEPLNGGAIRMAEGEGLLTQAGSRIAATSKGRLVLNALIAALAG